MGEIEENRSTSDASLFRTYLLFSTPYPTSILSTLNLLLAMQETSFVNTTLCPTLPQTHLNPTVPYTLQSTQQGPYTACDHAQRNRPDSTKTHPRT